MRHTLSIWVENRSGELSRIVGLFAARGYNIQSLTVAETPDPSVLLITLVTTGNEHAIEQIVQRVDKQVRVLKAMDVSGLQHTEREMALVSVEADIGAVLREVLQLVVLNRLKLVAVSENSVTLEATGNWHGVNELIALLSSLGVGEIVRSGTVALTSLSPVTAARHIADAGLTVGSSVSGFSEPASKAEP